MAVLYLSQVPEALEAAMRFPQTPWGQTVKPKESFRCVEYLRLPEQPDRYIEIWWKQRGKTVMWVPVVVASWPMSTVSGVEGLLLLLGGSAEGW